LLQKIITGGYRVLIRRKASKRRMNVIEANREANKAFEEHAADRFYKQRFVTDQSRLGDFKFGNSNAAHAGCEIIAVLNACELCRNMMDRDGSFDRAFGKDSDMLLLDKIRGDRILFSDMIYRAETGGYLLRFGKWGTNPMWLPEFASVYGIKLEKIKKEVPSEEGIYILSFWNDKRVKSGVHTACIQIIGDTAVAYNLNYTKQPETFDVPALRKLFENMPLVAVYRVHPGK